MQNYQPPIKAGEKSREPLRVSEYDEALPVFLKLLQKNPDNAEFCYNTGICYYYSSTSARSVFRISNNGEDNPGEDEA